MTDAPSTTTTTRSTIATLNVLNLVAYMANVGLVNGVPTLLKLPDNAEVSAKYQTLVTPAGWAFAIWGLIFLTQAIWSIVQIAVPAARSNRQVVEGVGKKYIAVCFFQSAWTFAFAYEEMTLSLVFMLGILYYLYNIYMSQQIVADQDDEIDDVSSSSSKTYWLFQFPFGLHFGWIVAASLVNANLVLVAYGASASFMFAAAVTTVLIAWAVASFTLYKESQKDHSPTVVVPGVLIWALNAISKELGHPKDLILNTYSTHQIEIVQKLSLSAAAILFVLVHVVVLQKYCHRSSQGDSTPETISNAPLLNDSRTNAD